MKTMSAVVVFFARIQRVRYHFQAFRNRKNSVLHKVLKGTRSQRNVQDIFHTEEELLRSKTLGVNRWWLCSVVNLEIEDLSAMRYSSLCKTVGSAKSFVTPERLPPTSSATKYHALRSYLQVMLYGTLTHSLTHSGRMAIT